MITSSKNRTKALISSLFIIGIALFYSGKAVVSLSILLSSLVLYAIARAKIPRRLNDSELLAFLRVFIEDYKLTKSVPLAIEASLKYGFSFSGRLKRMLAVHKFGGAPETANADNLDKLVVLLSDGYKAGADISDALKLFERRISEEVEKRNNNAKFSSGMEVITQAGMSFFFPMFGGISVGILDFISHAAIATFQEKFSMIIVGYMLMISLLYSTFYKSVRSAIDALYTSIPYVSIGITIFLLSVTLIHEVI